MKSAGKLALILAAIAIFALLVRADPALSASCEDSCDDKSGDEKLSCLNEVKNACESKLNEIVDKKQTLQSTVDYLNTQIALTQSKINQTAYEIEQLENEIEELNQRIGILDVSLERTTHLLLSRVSATYKQARIHPLSVFFSSSGISDLINRYRYLKAAQLNDRRLLYEMEQARANYDAQKSLKEEKQEKVLGLQTELVQEKKVHDQQKREKEYLLEVTRNDEKRYQELLAKARAELVAIQAIIAGQGDESEVKQVNEGDKIASIMTSGPNLFACSTGPHLHFEVAKDQGHQDPFSFLSAKSLDWDNLDEPRTGSGSWRWPLEDPIRITQSYGDTVYSSRYAGGIHTGIDMVNDDNRDVKAARKGTLYRGSIQCRGGLLQYVHVEHADDEYDAYYLHVDYF